MIFNQNPSLPNQTDGNSLEESLNKTDIPKNHQLRSVKFLIVALIGIKFFEFFSAINEYVSLPKDSYNSQYKQSFLLFLPILLFICMFVLCIIAYIQVESF